MSEATKVPDAEKVSDKTLRWWADNGRDLEQRRIARELQFARTQLAETQAALDEAEGRIGLLRVELAEATQALDTLSAEHAKQGKELIAMDMENDALRLERIQTKDWYDHQIAIVNGRNLELETALDTLKGQVAALQWRRITPEDLPKEGDEVGGIFGMFDPQWEARPFKWPMPSSQSLKPEIIYEGCRIAGWTHVRPLNADALIQARAQVSK